jgi:hypothetical protein
MRHRLSLPLGKYHSTSTIASSRLRLAAVRGAVYGASFAIGVLLRRVWNGIFEAGYWRAYNFAVELRLLVADRVNSGTSVRR